MRNSPTIISLFSGAGGLDYGFEAAGYRTAVAVEMDRDCCQTLRANRDWPVLERDIFSVTTAELLDVAGLARGQADALIGGPPCQPFSKSGYWARGDSNRLNDPRADTLSAYLRVVEESLPRVFLLENVGGLAYANKNEGLRLILDRVRQINKRTGSKYEPECRLLGAAHYGVPQLRERFFVVASRDGGAFRFPPPTHGEPTAPTALQLDFDSLEPFHTAWDALADVGPEQGEDVGLHGKWAELLPSIPEGNNYLWHTDRGGGQPLFGWRRRYWSFLLKLAKDRPSWTLQAQPGPATGPFHWKNRRLSMRELCRLQTFPDGVRIVGRPTSIRKQVGNAVPSLLAEVLARAIGDQLLGLPTLAAPLKLMPARRTPVPAPEPIAKVPRKYLALRGAHAPHPGTGQGYRAALWAEAEASGED